jgi:hypothetical protein
LLWLQLLVKLLLEPSWQLLLLPRWLRRQHLWLLQLLLLWPISYRRRGRCP